MQRGLAASRLGCRQHRGAAGGGRARSAQHDDPQVATCSTSPRRAPIPIPSCARPPTPRSPRSTPAAADRPRRQSVPGHQPRQRAAARRDRARHHLRRDGRHQHGAWRDDHARRLCRLCLQQCFAPSCRRAGSAPISSSRCRWRSCSPGWSASLLERCLIRFLYGRPLETLLATWGVSLILQQAVRSIFGSPNKEVANPSWMTGGFDDRRRLHDHLEPRSSSSSSALSCSARWR